MSNNIKLESPIIPVNLTLAQDPNLTYVELQTFIWKGAWSADPTTYRIYDVVFYNGSSYVNTTGVNTSTYPNLDTDNWNLLASKGDAGAAGVAGATGPANTLTIGTVTAGTSASASITGTAPNQTLNLTIPRGDTGETGSPGPSGVVSVTSPITNTGTSTSANIGINQSLISIGPSQVTGTAVITTDSRLSDTRTPTAGSVVDASITSAGLSPSKITGTAVITTDSRLSNSRTPTGSAGGDLSGTYPNPTLAGSIPDSKLNTISTSGKVSNSATTATSANTANTIVARDSSGRIAANQITISGTPTDAADVVTKSYADSISAGMNWHDACDYATTTVLPNSPVYTDGTADASNGLGVGAYLQATTNGTLSIDSNTTWTVGQRVLVKDQENAKKQNGIYTVSSAGSGSSLWKLIRATDTDNSVAGQVKAGDAVFITSNPSTTVNGNQGFIQTGVGSNPDKSLIIKVNTAGGDDIIFTQFTGTSTLVAGLGLTKTGNTIDVNTANSGNIVVNADNIDLATVTKTTPTGSAGTSFVQSIASDSYGRVTNVTTASINVGTTAGTIAAGNDSRITNAAQINAANTFTTGPQTISPATDVKGIVVKASSGQTANLLEFQDAASGTLSYFSSSGTLAFGSGTIISNANGRGLFITSSAAAVPITARGASGQTANLQEWQNSSGTATSYINSSGGIQVNTSSISGVSGRAYFETTLTTSVPITARGAYGQSVSLQEWQDSNGGVLADINATGAIRTSNSFASTTSGLTYLKPNYDTNGMGIVIQSAAHKGVIVKAAASQTANLQEWQIIYNTGNVSASGTTTVTGSGTTFTTAMVGGTLTVGANTYTITAWTSATSITINTSATFSNSSYSIVYTPLSINNAGYIAGGARFSAATSSPDGGRTGQAIVLDPTTDTSAYPKTSSIQLVTDPLNVI